MKNNINHFAGCLLGGALGDALGAPVETLTYKEITREYGHDGVVELQCGIHGFAEITNDTQLTLFTAEGLLRAKCRRDKKGITKDLRETTNVIFRAYLRWLYTQGLSTSNWSGSDYDGWLVGVKPLYVNKEIETTCITTLGKGIKGRLSKPINNSSTCGTVIRVAPVGLFADSREEAFELGNRVGAITHGHPLAYYSSGAMALLIHNIIEGMSIMDATLEVISELKKYENTQEAVDKLELAIDLYQSKYPSMQALKKLGRGREAIETLGIGVYCALTYPDDIVKALKLAVNHSGDSDSTGSVTGNIVGAYLGKDAIPTDWIEKLQLAKEIEKMATDLHTRHCNEEDWEFKYPSW
ncbi:MAG TPA: ADP-ribosylglycohydrolase family protein [Epulopiscium sp.]|nr:ADP-ribosylglycohydrolase family protein [Candidatus Epulonipiscium sp.]